MKWTDEKHDQVAALWAEGYSAAEIGRRMGVSKNAIVGKVHRLDLPGRPSPIERCGERLVARVHAHTDRERCGEQPAAELLHALARLAHATVELGHAAPPRLPVAGQARCAVRGNDCGCQLCAADAAGKD
jgi:GcrA cell cycle regulator